MLVGDICYHWTKQALHYLLSCFQIVKLNQKLAAGVS